MSNKLGFSLIEVIIGIVIIAGIVVSSISLNTNNDLDETTLRIMSKLEYTQKLGQNAPASGYYKVNGADTLPFVLFREKSMISLSAKDNSENLIENTEKYSSNGNEIKVSTNLEDGDFIFSSQGFVYDKNGRPVGNAHVYVTKGNTTKTISIDCNGKISKSTGKDTSELTVCKNTTTEGEYKFPESSIVECNDDTEDMWDGKCLKKCGDHATRNASGTCDCDSGYELHNDVCSYVYKPKQCGTNETLVGYNKWSSSGTCTCVSGYEINNGTCSYVYKPKQCGANETVTGYNKWSSSGTCTCKSGYETFNGKCIAVCPTGQTRQGDGSCKEETIANLIYRGNWEDHSYCDATGSDDESECDFTQWWDWYGLNMTYSAPKSFTNLSVVVDGKTFKNVKDTGVHHRLGYNEYFDNYIINNPNTYEYTTSQFEWSIDITHYKNDNKVTVSVEAGCLQSCPSNTNLNTFISSIKIFYK